MAGTISPIYDAEAEALKRQMAFANALRDKGMSNDIGGGYRGGKVFIVGNPLGNIASSIGGAILANRAEAGQRGLEQQRDAQLQQFLTTRPSAYTTTNPEGPTQTGEALAPVQTPKPYQQQVQEHGDWAAGGLNVKHPLAQSIGMRGVQTMGEAPLKFAQLEMQQQEVARQKEIARQQTEEMIRLRASLGRERDEWRYSTPNVNAAGAVVQAVRPDGTIGPTVVSKTQMGDTGLISPETPSQIAERERATKAVTEKKEAVGKFEQSMIPILSNLDELFPKGKINPNLDAYVGKFNVKVPDMALSDATLTSGKQFESLRSQQLIQNLADAKKAVGQSFGAITEREWDKFQNLLGNLERGNTSQGLEQTNRQIRQWIERHRATLERASQQAVPAPEKPRPSALPRSTGGFPQMNPQGSNGSLTRADILRDEYNNLNPNSPNYARDKQLLEREMGIGSAPAPAPAAAAPSARRKYNPATGDFE